MSVIDDVGKKLVQTFMGLDDLLLLQELAGNGVEQAGEASRSLVGAAVAGSGLAARTATFGAQLGTKSAKAAVDAVQGMVPGGEVAKQIADDVDRRVAESGQQASRLAAHGAGVHRDGTPRNPLTGDSWLEKKLGDGEGWNTLLADSAVDLARMLAMPLTVGVSAGAAAASTPTGREVTRYSWNALSALADVLAGHRGEGSEARAEARAALLALGLSPLGAATRDLVDVGEGMTRLAFGDGRKLKAALEQAIDRLAVDDSDADADAALGLLRALRERSRQRADHTPTSVLSANDDAEGDVVSSYTRHATALVEDGGKLGTLLLIYSELLARLGVNGAHAVLNGWRDVDAIDSWVEDDETARERDPDRGIESGRPVAVEQLEAVAAAVARRDGEDPSRSFFSRAALELAQDTVYSYTERAADRRQALARVERLFGAEARDRVRDDCSLRKEVRQASGVRSRLRALQDIVHELRRESLDSLLDARKHAARRLGSLQTADPLVENALTHRYAERVEALYDFIGLVDRTVAHEGEAPAAEPARQRVFHELNQAVARLRRPTAA